jgi:hypothetical protein
MARNEEIAAIVQNLGNNPTADAIHPKVEIGDLSLGQIGYYNASGTWVPDRIEIAPLENSTSYAFYDTDGDGTNEWGKVEGVRVTVTCRVGKEEETVSAYIRKSAVTASSNAGNGEVKGLQEAGGNNFRNGTDVYGGLGVGLTDTVLETQHYHNDSKIYTSLNFFNANLIHATSTFDIRIQKPVKAAGDVSPINTPYSETVITGYYMNENDTSFTIDYSIADSDVMDVKDVPYFYVNELITAPKGVSSKMYFGKPASGNKTAPFNVYAGTMYLPDAAIEGHADIYLMDAYNSDPNMAYNAIYKDRDGNTDASRDVKGILRGDNVIGASQGGNHSLYEWVGSVINKNEVDSRSYGGNIYCNGNLTFGDNITIDGDVRVMGEFYAGGNVKIKGDLVVRGNVHQNNTNGKSPLSVDGDTYTGSGTGGGVKPTYTHHINELLPGYTEVVNIKFENNEVPNVVEDTDSEGNTIYTILDGEGGGDVYPSKPYYRIKADGTEDITDITTKQFSIYESIKIGDDVVVVLDGDGNAILTDDEVTYYDEFNTKVDKDAAIDSYYTNAAGEIVPDSEALNPVVSGQDLSYDAFVNKTGEQAYPQSMTREKIYGEHTGLGFQPADPKTKIITTLQEARTALNMDPTDGSFSSSVYINAVPGGDPAAWDGSTTITSSCTIKNTTINDDITIDTASEIWIVLDNCSIASGKTIKVQEDPTGKHGTVNFLIRGTVKLGNQAKIITSSVSNGCTVSYTKDFGILYYAEAAKNVAGTLVLPTLTMGMESMICGSVKAPTLKVYASKYGGWEIKYISEYSSTPVSTHPNVLGNALIDHVEKDPNEGDLSNFAVIYTKSGAGGSVSGGGGGLVPTSLGYFDIGYLAGA